MRHTALEERCVCLIPRRLSLFSLSLVLYNMRVCVLWVPALRFSCHVVSLSSCRNSSADANQFWSGPSASEWRARRLPVPAKTCHLQISHDCSRASLWCASVGEKDARTSCVQLFHGIKEDTLRRRLCRNSSGDCRPDKLNFDQKVCGDEIIFPH